MCLQSLQDANFGHSQSLYCLLLILFTGRSCEGKLDYGSTELSSETADIAGCDACLEGEIELFLETLRSTLFLKMALGVNFSRIS